MSKYILLISGAPAAGKSSVASGLAAALREFALLQKDPIKEALFEQLTEGERRVEGCSRRLSEAAMRVLWSLAPGCPRVILEANFRTLDPGERMKFQALRGHKLEIHCRCPYEVVAQRFARRAAARHPAHTLQTLSPALFAEFEQPFGLAPVLEVETSGPLDLDSLVAQLQAHWPELA